MSAAPLRIGTRASLLARTQTQWVANQLTAAGIDVQIEIIETSGDLRTDIPIARIGGDGVFVRELERALFDRRIDVAVHSMKDLPTAETPGLAIPCVPKRATPFDAFVGRAAPTLADLPPGAIVGTSSVRRVVQVKACRGDLVIKPIRGNVDTRLRKLEAGEYDGLILAGAGLERLGLAGRITQLLEPPLFAPAIAQGALAVQIRDGDEAARAAVVPISDEPTHRAVRAERACLAALAGGCLAPIAGWGREDAAGRLVLDAWVFEDRGADVLGIHETAVAEVGRERPETLGARVAGGLVDRGATMMLQRGRSGGAVN
ncbi:MAG: hydroxymethylbilane synthase [Planctomycetota bacterium]|jgi:hydroxymethylbilane synthase|nr:hydroxymethylbilane synthase [Planctomycetota bacterium]